MGPRGRGWGGSCPMCISRGKDREPELQSVSQICSSSNCNVRLVLGLSQFLLMIRMGQKMLLSLEKWSKVTEK